MIPSNTSYAIIANEYTSHFNPYSSFLNTSGAMYLYAPVSPVIKKAWSYSCEYTCSP